MVSDLLRPGNKKQKREESLKFSGKDKGFWAFILLEEVVSINRIEARFSPDINCVITTQN